MKKVDLDTHTQTEMYEIIGENLAELLYLKPNAQGRYPTEWGAKTAQGLYHSIVRILDNDV